MIIIVGALIWNSFLLNFSSLMLKVYFIYLIWYRKYHVWVGELSNFVSILSSYRCLIVPLMLNFHENIRVLKIHRNAFVWGLVRQGIKLRAELSRSGKFGMKSHLIRGALTGQSILESSLGKIICLSDYVFHSIDAKTGYHFISVMGT